MASSSEEITKLIKGLQDAITAFDAAKKSGKDGTDAFNSSIRDLLRGQEQFSNGLGMMSSGLEQFSNMSRKSSTTLSDTVSILGKGGEAVKAFTESFKSIPFVGNLLGELGGTIAQTAEFIANTAEAGLNLAKVYDGMDKGTRDNLATQYKFAASLGMSFDQAKKNVDVFEDLIIANSEFAQKGIYFNSEEFKGGISALQSAGISMEELGRASEVAANGMNNMQAMSMQAKAMGMSIEEYSSKIASMVRKNGLSIEDSMKLMASSQNIAAETGLKIDEVTSSLEAATSGFQRMGATMDFGRPVLKGFADSVKDVGLGIAQAGDLASEFSKSLLNITNNPALAYMTAMKGGFAGGMGGPGGILNPSIQMQAMMLDQSPGGQAELAKSLSTGMSEMLKSQTGGQIITVKEAAAGDAGTQSRFYAQQQMLGSVYGISDTATQSRVLEYLKNLEKATADGDDEMIQKINDQIKDATEGNDKTMDIQQKISLSLDKATILLQEQVNIFKAQLSKNEGDAIKYIGNIADLTAQLATAEGSDKKRIEGEIAKNQKDLDLNALMSVAKQAGQKASETNATTPETNADNVKMGTSGVANAATAQNVQSTVNVGLNFVSERGAEVKATLISATPGIVSIDAVRNTVR